MKTLAILTLAGIVILLAWAIRQLRIEIKKHEEEYFQMRKSNKELLEVNYKLTQKKPNEINPN